MTPYLQFNHIRMEGTRENGYKQKCRCVWKQHFDALHQRNCARHTCLVPYAACKGVWKKKPPKGPVYNREIDGLALNGTESRSARFRSVKIKKKNFSFTNQYLLYLTSDNMESTAMYFLMSREYQERYLWVSISRTSLFFCLCLGLLFHWHSPFKNVNTAGNEKWPECKIATCLNENWMRPGTGFQWPFLIEWQETFK